MTNNDIKATLAELSRRKWELENALEENGGELTDELLQQAADIDELKALLEGEGIDALGRQLKAVQDEIATLKAEADAAARKVKNAKSYEDYLKFQIGQALDAVGKDAVKGSFYGFKRTTSTKSSVLTDKLDEAYLETATEAARNAGLPSFVDVALVTTTTRLREWAKEYEEDGALEFLEETTTPALRFQKPVASRKKED